MVITEENDDANEPIEFKTVQISLNF